MDFGKSFDSDIDTFRIRFWILLSAYTIVTAFFVVPRANGVDGTTVIDIISGAVWNLFITGITYSVRAKVFGRWMSIRKLFFGLFFELFFYALIYLSLLHFLKRPFSFSYYYLNLPYIISIIHAFTVLLKSSTSPKKL